MHTTNSINYYEFSVNLPYDANNLNKKIIIENIYIPYHTDMNHHHLVFNADLSIANDKQATYSIKNNAGIKSIIAHSADTPDDIISQASQWIVLYNNPTPPLTPTQATFNQMVRSLEDIPQPDGVTKEIPLNNPEETNSDGL